MAHGPHAGDGAAEPNLVPLLDLVLQLVMFFMMCANFVMEENDQTIKLPLSQQARPVADTGPDVFHLAVDERGAVRVVGRPPITSEEQLVVLLHDVYDGARRLSLERKQGGEVKTLVVIRAHHDASFEQ